MRKLLNLIMMLLLLAFPPLTFAEGRELLLDGVDGQQHTLNEYIGHGKWVVVNVWATACPYCRHELFDLINFHDTHHEGDAMVLGLTVDFPSFEQPDRTHVARFASDHFIEFPLLLVSAEKASKVVGQSVDMVPLSFFYNPSGKLVHRINGMVTEGMLEEVVKNKHTDYHTEWAEEVPPMYQPQ